jgi:hypothetical protein
LEEIIDRLLQRCGQVHHRPSIDVVLHAYGD